MTVMTWRSPGPVIPTRSDCRLAALHGSAVARHGAKRNAGGPERPPDSASLHPGYQIRASPRRARLGQLHGGHASLGGEPDRQGAARHLDESRDRVEQRHQVRIAWRELVGALLDAIDQ